MNTLPDAVGTLAHQASRQDKPGNPRRLAAQILAAVIDEKRSLNEVLAAALESVEGRDRALLQELCYGTLRWYHQLNYFLQQLLSKPFKQRDRELHMLLVSGLYQLLYMRTPAYAAVSASVALAPDMGKPWAAKLINAVLRNFERQRGTLLAGIKHEPELLYSLPDWLLQRLQQDWPQHWQNIAEADNGHPPQSLRVNLARVARSDYLQQLRDAGFAAEPARYIASAITLAQPVSVNQLPGFGQGLVSVQDAAAQLAAPLLDLQPGQQVLDACAAPGGKSCHILEQMHQISLLALDNDAVRLDKLRQNLQRLQLSATVMTGDAGQPQQWWDGRRFDRILLDAPCSASGVIRRHPDIKLLRRNSDIDQFAGYQARLLERLWPLLQPGGKLLYATCSVFRQENSDIVQRFMEAHRDAREHCLEHSGWGHPCAHGRQILPGEAGMDGFYYACLVKHTGI